MSIGVWLAKSAFHGQRQEFYEDLAEALHDGDQLAGRIEQLAERFSSEGDLQAPLFRLWFDRMDDQSFTEALSGTVPDSDLMILQAAEQSGDLVSGLKFTARVIEATKVMRSVLRKAVAGFAFLTLLQIVLLAGFSFYGLSILEEIVPPTAWPWIGLQLRGLAHFVTGSGHWVLAGGVLIGIGYTWSLRNWYGRTRVVFDRFVLPYTIYRDFNSAMFLVSLAALMKNGVALNAALDTLSERASPWLSWHIREVQLKLDYQSDSAGEAFDTGLFNRSLTWRIIDFGRRAGSDFAEAIEKVGIKSMDRVMESVKEKAGNLNTMLLLLNAGMIVFIVLGALLTVYEAQEQMQKQINSNQQRMK